MTQVQPSVHLKNSIYRGRDDTMPLDQTKKPGEAVFVGILLLFSLTALWLSYEISGFESISAPGILPLLASVLLVGSSLVICRQTWALAPPPADASFFTQLTPLILVSFLGLGLIYVLGLYLFGFLPATFAYLFVSILYLHRQGWLLAFFVSVNSLAIVYMVFRLLFKVILPEGSLLEGVGL